MSNPLAQNLFLIKERVGLFKAANKFDVFDPSSGELLMICDEPYLGIFTKLFRFTDYKRMSPFHVVITDADGDVLVNVKRGTTFFRSVVRVEDTDGDVLGYFKQKFFSIGPSFTILNAQEKEVCYLKGKWHGWDFRFMAGDVELAHISKKWAGIGKELFTSADNYILEISASVPSDSPIRALILSAVMTIDLVLKE